MVRAEQPSDVAGVDDRGVEVDVVADLDGQAQLGVGERHERARLRPGPVGPQHRAHRASQASLGLRPQRQQAVEGGRLAGRGDDLRRTVEEPQLAAAPEIEHLVPDRDAEARLVRPSAAAEDAEREVLDREVAGRIVCAGHPASQPCSGLTQRAVARLLGRGFAGHLDRLRAGFQRRRDALLAALGEHFPESARWTRPPGGFFVWVELPPGLDGDRVCEEALAEARVAVVPGSAFAASAGAPANRLRLNFASCAPDEIRTAVERLGRLLGRRLHHG